LKGGDNMPFYGTSFLYKDIPSEQYDLYLGNINDSGEGTTSGSNDVNLLTQKLFRRPTLMLLGVEQSPNLSFPIYVYSPEEISALDYSQISAWLFGQQNYSKFQIVQEDMIDIYFNAFLTAPNIVRVGNFIKAFTTTVQCDSPWGFREPKTYTYTYGDSYTINQDIIFLNESANAFYTYPTSFIVTANIFGGNFLLINHSDNERTFTLGTVTDPLLPNEVITMNPDQQLVSSNLTTYPLSKTSTNWIRFLPGYNLLTVSGNISSFSFTIPIAAKVA
jgi:hypothetical protein